MKRNINNYLIDNNGYFNKAIELMTQYIYSINGEAVLLYDFPPINYVLSRIKNVDSIEEKIIRKKYPKRKSSINKVHDIVGIRVVCDFVDNIYYVIDKIKKCPSIKILNEKDYIKNPKISGYRGYHLIVSLPVSVNRVKKEIEIEIQIRTLAMDSWAANEHKLCYKKNIVDQSIINSLKENANATWNVDLSMNEIYLKNKKEVYSTISNEKNSKKINTLEAFD